MLLASAAIDPNSPSPATMDPEDNGALEKSRLAIFEFHANDHLAPLEVSLVKVGQWFFDGAAHSVGLHHEPDSMRLLLLSGYLSHLPLDTSTFVSINTNGHFVARGLQLLPRVPVQMDAFVPETQSTNLVSIPLPNPFKALKPRSTEPSSDLSREVGRVALDDERDLGELLASGSPSGFRLRSSNGKMIAIAWSQQELTVSDPPIHKGSYH